MFTPFDRLRQRGSYQAASSAGLRRRHRPHALYDIQPRNLERQFEREFIRPQSQLFNRAKWGIGAAAASLVALAAHQAVKNRYKVAPRPSAAPLPARRIREGYKQNINEYPRRSYSNKRVRWANFFRTLKGLTGGDRQYDTRTAFYEVEKPNGTKVKAFRIPRGMLKVGIGRDNTPLVAVRHDNTWDRNIQNIYRF